MDELIDECINGWNLEGRVNVYFLPGMLNPLYR